MQEIKSIYVNLPIKNIEKPGHFGRDWALVLIHNLVMKKPCV